MEIRANGFSLSRRVTEGRGIDGEKSPAKVNMCSLRATLRNESHLMGQIYKVWTNIVRNSDYRSARQLHASKSQLPVALAYISQLGYL